MPLMRKTLLQSMAIKSQRGMTHAMLLVALVVASGVGYVGYRVTTSSSASTTPAAVCGSGYSKLVASNYRLGGEVVGQTVLMSNGNQLCGVFLAKNAADNGIAKRMQVYITKGNNWACIANTKKDSWHETLDTTSLTIYDKDRYIYDKGQFKQYAGPVRRSTGPSGTCHWLYGEMVYKGKLRTASLYYKW